MITQMITIGKEFDRSGQCLLKPSNLDVEPGVAKKITKNL